MIEQPLVTVLMPCFNAMPFLTEALESIINQTYDNLEILCINDGSTDETAQVLETYASRDKRIRVIHNEENLKLIRALNKGIDLANGEYIARMDADDICYLNRIEISVAYLQKHPEIDVLSPNKTIIDEQGNIISECIVRNRSVISTYFASFFYASVGHPEVICKTNILRENSYSLSEEALHVEDYEIWGRLLNKGAKIVCIDIPLLYYRINNHSVSRLYADIQDSNFIVQGNSFYNSYTGRGISLNISKVISNRIDSLVNIFEFRKGISEYKFFKSYFVRKENIVDEVELNEIDLVYNTHLLDISLQSLKKARFGVKIIALPILFKLLVKSFFDQGLRRYLRSKLSKR